MRVLCCLDGMNLESITSAMNMYVKQEGLTIGLLYVIDSGPHGEMERQRERMLRSGPLPLARRERMQQAEQLAAQDILEEARLRLPHAEVLQRAGRPEREIVESALQWSADLIVICPRSPSGEPLPPGPKSVGHVARFVLDHAPCPVLLVRPR